MPGSSADPAGTSGQARYNNHRKHLRYASAFSDSAGSFLPSAAALQHLYDLRTGQGSVLREPFDHILFIGQQHDNHLLLYSFAPKCVFRAKYALLIRLLLPLLENGFQLGTVGRDHFLFLFGRLNDDRHLTVVGTDQRLAAFKAGNGTDLGLRKLQRIPDKLRFVRFQIQNDLILELLIIARP